MAFDYKKEYKELYQPPKKPVIVTIPAMNLRQGKDMQWTFLTGGITKFT